MTKSPPCHEVSPFNEGWLFPCQKPSQPVKTAFQIVNSFLFVDLLFNFYLSTRSLWAFPFSFRTLLCGFCFVRLFGISWFCLSRFLLTVPLFCLFSRHLYDTRLGILKFDILNVLALLTSAVDLALAFKASAIKIFASDLVVGLLLGTSSTTFSFPFFDTLTSLLSTFHWIDSSSLAESEELEDGYLPKSGVLSKIGWVSLIS